eukprot:TRINITY_DN58708_c0_g1_i1.p1 TRINITY_DN58708_c0_g1~~TRINITY_DN58708_c0_g1_i1.p1  ORF type:complete len:524 (+),score=13.14 TRINITY_DN58708_c0_g1_i1:60-1631(+)
MSYNVGFYTDIPFPELEEGLLQQLPISQFRLLTPDQKPPGYEDVEEDEEREKKLDCIMIGFCSTGNRLPLAFGVISALHDFLVDGGNIVLFALSVFNDGNLFELGLDIPLMRAPYDDSCAACEYTVYMANHILLQGVDDYQTFSHHNICGGLSECNVVAAYTVDESPLVGYSKALGKRIAIVNVLPTKYHPFHGKIDDEEYDAACTLLANAISYMCLPTRPEGDDHNDDSDDPVVQALIEKGKTLAGAQHVQFFRLDADGELVDDAGELEPQSQYLLHLCIDNVETRMAPHCMYLPFCDWNFDDEEYVWAVMEATKPGSSKPFCEKDEKRLATLRNDPLLRNLHSFRPPPASKDSTSGPMSFLSLVKQAQRRASKAMFLPERKDRRGTLAERDSIASTATSARMSIAPTTPSSAGILPEFPMRRKRGADLSLRQESTVTLSKFTVSFAADEEEDKNNRRLQRRAFANDDEPTIDSGVPNPLPQIGRRKSFGLGELLEQAAKEAEEAELREEEENELNSETDSN